MISTSGTNTLTQMYKLENWSLGPLPGQEYVAPECQLLAITGNVYNHPKWDDGHEIITSYVVGTKQNIVITNSGSEYELGEPNAEYVEWCKEQGCHVPTKDEPIRSLV